MLREASAAHEQDWSEKTMSVLREKQFEACERRLSESPAINLFSPDATDMHAQMLLESSYFATEPGNDGLATLEGLRQKVLDLLPLEALYLSTGERNMLERMLISDGSVTSENWDEIDAAEALARRLWCSFTDNGEEWTLTIGEALRDPLLLAFNNPEYSETRGRMFRFDATISGLLYIAGFLPSDQPLTFFTKDVMERTDATAINIAYRYMKATFEYFDDVDRGILLVHPGLADPKRIIDNLSGNDNITLSLSEETLAGGMNGILPEEEQLHNDMRGALEGQMRPEWDAQEAAEDLRLLAKQGVSLQGMETVMASMICVLPTQAMKTALQHLYDRTPHWIGMTANLRH